MSCSYCKSTEHQIRNYKAMNAPIICPVLLKVTCTYCGKNGHKIHKCSLKLKDERNTKRKIVITKDKKKETIVMKRFDVLEIDDLEDKVPLPAQEKITGKRKGDWSLMVDSDSDEE